MNSQGNPLEWDAIWQAGESVLFTRGEPQTLREVWQRGYSLDLETLTRSLAPSSVFLELGSGRGTTSMYLAASGRRVVLVDLALNGLRTANRNFSEFGLPRPELVMSDATEIGIATESVDCIYNIGVLEHFEEPGYLLREALRVLKPGGLIFMVVVPRVPKYRRWPLLGLFSPLQLLREVRDHLRGHGDQETGEAIIRTEYTRRFYVELIKSLGVKDVAVHSYNPYQPVYALDSALERKILVPLFRFHLNVRRRLGCRLLLKAPKAVSFCDLIVCTK